MNLKTRYLLIAVSFVLVKTMVDIAVNQALNGWYYRNLPLHRMLFKFGSRNVVLYSILLLVIAGNHWLFWRISGRNLDRPFYYVFLLLGFVAMVMLCYYPAPIIMDPL